MSVKVCRRCGCTDLTACFTVTAEIEPVGYGRHVLRNLSNSVACHWVEDDLCSACPQQVEAQTESEPDRVVVPDAMLTLHSDNTVRVGDTVVGHADPETAEQARADVLKHLSIKPPVRVIDKFEPMYVSIDSQPNAFGEGITLVERPSTFQPTHQICPAGDGGTHHLLPAKAGGGELVCKYCFRTEREIREEAT